MKWLGRVRAVFDRSLDPLPGGKSASRAVDNLSLIVGLPTEDPSNEQPPRVRELPLGQCLVVECNAIAPCWRAGDLILDHGRSRKSLDSERPDGVPRRLAWLAAIAHPADTDGTSGAASGTAHT